MLLSRPATAISRMLPRDRGLVRTFHAQGGSNGTFDVFVRDLQAGTTTRVSVNSEETQANGNSHEPSISADGRYVVFLSTATIWLRVTPTVLMTSSCATLYSARPRGSASIQMKFRRTGRAIGGPRFRPTGARWRLVRKPATWSPTTPTGPLTYSSLRTFS